MDFYRFLPEPAAEGGALLLPLGNHAITLDSDICPYGLSTTLRYYLQKSEESDFAACLAYRLKSPRCPKPNGSVPEAPQLRRRPHRQPEAAGHSPAVKSPAGHSPADHSPEPRIANEAGDPSPEALAAPEAAGEPPIANEAGDTSPEPEAAPEAAGEPPIAPEAAVPSPEPLPAPEAAYQSPEALAAPKAAPALINPDLDSHIRTIIQEELKNFKEECVQYTLDKFRGMNVRGVVVEEIQTYVRDNVNDFVEELVNPSLVELVQTCEIFSMRMNENQPGDFYNLLEPSTSNFQNNDSSGLGEIGDFLTTAADFLFK